MMDEQVKNIYMNLLGRSRRQIEENDYKPRRVEEFYAWIIKEWIKDEQANNGR